ncbi:MAG TPA: DUF4331 domain-containing protein [Blastocatellia bacterium]|nr:DUF4331 domain-containing protein [Blastocatellia bacterium]
MNRIPLKPRRALALALIALMGFTPAFSVTALASSHMDAPLITRDPAANTTDVYAFVRPDQSGNKSLVIALGVYPHQNPGIGPNKYNFDENVRYEMHVALGGDVAAGRPSITYRFEFKTRFKNSKTLLQSYLGVVNDTDDASQNLTQTYTVRKIDNRSGLGASLGTGIVPPNNQGIATPFYNDGNNGENSARKGVATAAQLDKYTTAAITPLSNGYTAFAGQRDDGFYADVQAVFDLLKLRSPGKDAQGGFNIHLIALRIPLSELGGDQQTVGVFATTSRQMASVQPPTGRGILDIIRRPTYTQVARQGNPLFNEGLIAIEDKDTYSRTLPSVDGQIFRKYAMNPELTTLINALILQPNALAPAPDTNRGDIAAIFIPDLIKVDLSTDPVRLAGNGPNDATNPDDMGFSRLSIFGGDVLPSRAPGHPFRLANGSNFIVPGGWPNGRRFGDDVLDIAVIALISDLRNPANLIINNPLQGNYDGVTGNEMGYNKVFPYEATPQNGRKIIGLAQ